ncbi:MAG: type III-B CRISPR-associated protein Cas10/Cmr2 [Gammaproteobacteria bacterium]
MTDTNSNFWKTKLAAWLHDPAEKALILLRDREGHDWGTVKRLRDELGISHMDILKKADWYAAAADRPQIPMEGDKYFQSWMKVNFVDKPVLKHPLTSRDIDLRKLEVDVAPLKAISLDHFKDLIIRDENDNPNLHKTLLNYWRFGPESPASELNHLWQNLPADTRIPDHSIWAHLDIVSAFAGAMSTDANGTTALMAVSFGPVQGFIAEARSTSDLWAGSHLLAYIAWEGMKVVCNRLGPDAVLFPNLRGVPLVDVWLRDKMGLPAEQFEDMEWVNSKSDANPLFGAALPNRFVALVPADQTEDIAMEIERSVRRFIVDTGKATLAKILEAIGEQDSPDLPCYQQLDEQLNDFPEVHWAAAPWSLAESGDNPDGVKLKEVLSNFYPEDTKIGFLDSTAWHVLQQDIELDGAKFFRPNAGTLYPALYELLDRVAATAKSARPFNQLPQHGYRSSLNGEREWLTLDRDQLTAPPGECKETLWTRLADKKPSWAKKGEHLDAKGEHLDALNAIKRLWPTLFFEEVREIVGKHVGRYILSTHTLAIATSLEKLITDTEKTATLFKISREEDLKRYDAVSLPLSLHKKVKDDVHLNFVIRRLPSALDEDEEGKLARKLENVMGPKPETYYGIILFDGDKMGAWLAGNEDDFQTQYIESWHPTIQAKVKQKFSQNPKLKAYLESNRWPSPARHRAISEALNQFSLKVARFVMEDCFKGKLIYAGGDDVLAFVCVDDLLPAMTLLRYLYSGREVPGWLMARLSADMRKKFDSNNGYLRLDRKLLLTMGEKATASCGAVVAHHQAPLGYVLKRLRQAESEAKNSGSRNAFALKIIKRAGGEIGITDKWRRNPDAETDDEKKNAPELLFKLMDFLSREGVSRRATYNSVTWLNQLPPKPPLEMIKANLVYQFKQQAREKYLKEMGDALARELAAYAHAYFAGDSAHALAEMLMVGEFLARESRMEHEKPKKSVEDAA